MDDITSILKSIQAEYKTEKLRSDVKQYVALMNLYDEILNDKEKEPWYRVVAFENFFACYYGLDSAIINLEARNNLFTCFTEIIKGTDLNIEDIIRRTDSQIVYFSFATKLLATVDDSRPIYDSKVKISLGLDDVTGNGVEAKIDNALQIYNRLFEFYNDSGNNDLEFFKERCVEIFDRSFEEYKGYVSREKKIDFALWVMGRNELSIRDIALEW